MRSLKALFILLALLIFHNDINAQDYNVRIDGQIIGYDGISILNYTLSPVNFSHQVFTVKPDSLGRFSILKKMDSIKFFHLYYRNKGVAHQCKLIVEPGKSYSIISRGKPEKDWENHYTPDIYSWDNKNTDSFIRYSIDNGQMYYNLIDNGTSGSLYHDDWNLLEPESLIDTLQSRISRMVSVFSDLQKENKIDPEFFRIAKINCQYLQAYRLAVTIHDTWQLDQFAIVDSTIREKLYQVYPEIFELYPVEGVRLEQVFCFDKYVDEYLTFKADYKDGIFKPVKRKGAAYLKILDGAGDVLSPQAYKNYALRNIMSATASLELKSAGNARKFLEENPDVKNTPSGQLLQDVLIPRVDDFSKLSDEKFKEGVFILDEDKPVRSFRALVDSLKGKPFLIDLWGTWCGPCRYQFRYNDKLKNYLKENGIQMVYIAFEYEVDREKWKNMIKAFNLSGYHFISTDEFKTDFEKYAGKISGYPTYLIVDYHGRIVENKACFPSGKEKLYNQINEKLKN